MDGDGVAGPRAAAVPHGVPAAMGQVKKQKKVIAASNKDLDEQMAKLRGSIDQVGTFARPPLHAPLHAPHLATDAALLAGRLPSSCCGHSTTDLPAGLSAAAHDRAFVELPAAGLFFHRALVWGQPTTALSSPSSRHATPAADPVDGSHVVGRSSRLTVFAWTGCAEKVGVEGAAAGVGAVPATFRGRDHAPRFRAPRRTRHPPCAPRLPRQLPVLMPSQLPPPFLALLHSRVRQHKLESRHGRD